MWLFQALALMSLMSFVNQSHQNDRNRQNVSEAPKPSEAFATIGNATPQELGIKGFCAVGGKTAQGKALYAKAKALYAA